MTNYIGSLLPSLLVLFGMAGTTFFGLGVFRTNGRPIASFAQSVNLGDCEFGKIVTARMKISNSGQAELRVFGFSTSCSCAAIQIAVDGELRKIGELFLQPGEEVEVLAQISVGARPGTAQTIYIGFSTNDPSKSNNVIEIVIPCVKGGIWPDPLALTLGEIPTGAPLTKDIKIYDNGILKQKVNKIRSSQPSIFKAEFKDSSQLPKEPPHPTAGNFLGLVTVTVFSESPCVISGYVEVILEPQTTTADRIPITGEVTSVIYSRPESLTFPRFISGAEIYDGYINLFSSEESIADVSCPHSSGFLISVEKIDGNKGSCKVKISRNQDLSKKSAASSKSTVRLKILCSSGSTHTLDIPILMRSN